VSIAINEIHKGELRPTRLEEWPETGLPWAAFWLKELIAWGTLDPVAAMLLASGKADTRVDAENAAVAYYAEAGVTPANDEWLDARKIRQWVQKQGTLSRQRMASPPAFFRAALARDFGRRRSEEWRVFPSVSANSIKWRDAAGYVLASSKCPERWSDEFELDYDFLLKPDESVVRTEPFL
jgi:hypothetical protein